jgi:L-malate glycosyltransferase
MRVLYFSRSYTTHDRRFLAALADSPHEIWYLRLEDDTAHYESRPVPDGIRELDPLAGVRRATLPEQWIPLVPRLETVLGRVKPDLVHAGPLQSCTLLAALSGFHPLLAMSWGSDVLVDAQRDDFWEWMTRYSLRHSDMLISDCAEVSGAARRIGRQEACQIVQFPWGVDIASYHPGPDTLSLRGKVGWRDSTLVIGTRTWEPGYGVMHLLAGFRLAYARLPRLRLVLLGTGSQRAEVERFVAENGLRDAVDLAGAVPAERLPEYFRAADVYASCAYSDGSSLSLLEAMATGLPVLATDRPSNREWIGGPDQGLLAPFGDVSAIAAALMELAELPVDRRREIEARNRAVVEERANWKLNAARLLDTYQKLQTGLP